MLILSTCSPTILKCRLENLSSFRLPLSNRLLGHHMEIYGVLSASTLEGCWIDDLAERIRVKEMLVVLLVDRKCGRTDLECGTLTRKGKNPSFYCAVK